MDAAGASRGATGLVDGVPDGGFPSGVDREPSRFGGAGACGVEADGEVHLPS